MTIIKDYKTVPILLALILFLNCSPDNQTVKIGNQNWMAENLSTETFRNGDKIKHAKTIDEWVTSGKNKQPAWCYYENNSTNKKFGKIYNYYAVMDSRGLAPEGWHIPSVEEWNKLMNHLGGKNIAGSKLKSSSNWKGNLNKDSKNSFNGLPGGFRDKDGNFNMIGQYTIWWTSTQSFDNEGETREIGFYFEYLEENSRDAEFGCYIRCIKD